MRKVRLYIRAIILFTLICTSSVAQDKEPVFDNITNFPTSFLNKVQSRYATLEDRLTKQTEKYLMRLAKREKRLRKKMAKVDSAAAKQTFGEMRKGFMTWIKR